MAGDGTGGAAQPLVRERILAELDAQARRALISLEVLARVDSTNRYLLASEHAGDGVRAVLAEHQSAGRGRRGRAWFSPPGGNIYLSLARTFALPGRRLNGLSLAVGVAVASAIERCAAVEVQLKWPNDLLVGGEKLAGVLLEVVARGCGQSYVVVGAGVNVRMSGAAQAIDQPWTDLCRVCGSEPERNRLAGSIVGEILKALALYADKGFEGFSGEWGKRDALRGRSVELRAEGANVMRGTAMGVDDHDGAMLLSVEGRVHRILAGELSVRAAR